MATHDLRLGTTLVLLTFTNPEAAGRVSDAIEAERESLFQCDGVPLTIVEGERDAADDEIGEFAAGIHETSQANVLSMIPGLSSGEATEVLDAEQLNPRAQGPRPKIVAALEKYLVSGLEGAA